MFMSYPEFIPFLSLKPADQKVACTIIMRWFSQVIILQSNN